MNFSVIFGFLLCVLCAANVYANDQSMSEMRRLVEQLSETLNPQTRGGLGGGGLQGLKEKALPIGAKLCSVMGALNPAGGGGGGFGGGQGIGSGLLGGGGRGSGGGYGGESGYGSGSGSGYGSGGGYGGGHRGSGGRGSGGRGGGGRGQGFGGNFDE